MLKVNNYRQDIISRARERKKERVNDTENKIRNLIDTGRITIRNYER